MTFRVLIFLTFLSLTACSSEQDKMHANISKLEKALEGEATTENAEALVNEYTAYADQYPEDVEQNAKYLYRAAGVHYRMNRFTGATQLLNRALKEFFSSSQSPDNAYFLGNIYEEKLRSSESATTVYQAFQSAFPQHEKAAEAKARIPADAKDLNTRIEDLGQRMFNDSLGRIDYRVANDYITSCELHALLLPSSPETPGLLHKAGEMARYVKAFPKALEYYEWINTKYPDFEKAPQALFLRAFTLDNDLKRYDEARALYEEFLAKYPNDDFADDTQFLLENLGKDDEEIINSFSGEEESE